MRVLEAEADIRRASDLPPFSSLRVRGEPAGAQPGDPDPRAPFAADLGGGAACLLPLAVWADGKGTLPAAASEAGDGAARPAAGTAARPAAGTAARPAAGTAARPAAGAAPRTPSSHSGKPAGGSSAAAATATGAKAATGSATPAAGTEVAPVTPADRGSRLAIVMLTWNVLQHFHPGLAAGGVARAVAWQKALPAALLDAAEGTGTESLLAALRRMVAATDDGQATIAAAGDRRIYGLPLRWDWIEGQLVVTEVGAGVSGVRPGDAVTRLEGREVRTELKTAEALVAAATPQWRRWRALARLALGERGEPLRLDVEPAPHAVTVTHSVPPGELAPAGAAPKDAVHEASPGVLVVDLGRLAESDLDAALPRLAAASGIVFDLRGNVRATDRLLAHLIAAPEETRREMLPAWSRPDREAVHYQAVATPVMPAAPRLAGRLAFLAGARDVGAAESFLATVAELHLGAIVGSPTGGARGSVDSAPLPAGITVIWTAARPAAGAPVEPTVAVAPTRKGIAAGRDEVLEKALALVKPSATPGAR